MKLLFLQRVIKWLSLVEQYTHPTAPVELRQVVAIGLGNLWNILLQVRMFAHFIPTIVMNCFLYHCLKFMYGDDVFLSHIFERLIHCSQWKYTVCW